MHARDTGDALSGLSLQNPAGIWNRGLGVLTLCSQMVNVSCTAAFDTQAEGIQAGIITGTESTV